MMITGRLTGDATVHPVKDERMVVNFSIAINDRFKTKAGERREVTTYVNCSYWLSTKVADWLKKGTLVELYGRIGVDAYINAEGNAVGRITYHTNNIRLLASPKTATGDAPTVAANAQGAERDDLPF